MDYDKTGIPAVYDRARSRSPEVIARWMDAVAMHAAKAAALETIVDLGCGTGRFAAPLEARFRAQVIGIDPSFRMLDQARAKPEGWAVRYVVGRAERIPLASRSVDLIFMSMVLHHFADPLRVARECFRVLRKGGSVFLRAATAERIPEYPYTPHFPAVVPIMERILDRADDIVRGFASAGLRPTHSGILHQEIAPSHAVYADQLEAGGDSVLARLDADEMAAGLYALRDHASSVDPSPVIEPIDFFSFMKG